MRAFLLLSLTCLSLLSASAARIPQAQKVRKDRKFFVFGDSYADTGNTITLNDSAAFKPPSGITFPGKPTGRFSDGLITTDFLASKILGVASPPPYAQIVANTSASISGGINFAVGGSGVGVAFGTPPLRTQVEWFSSYVSAGAFTRDELKEAVVFVSVAGNDYSAYSGSIEGYIPLVQEVVNGIDSGLRILYSLGARNFMVPTLPALDCLPVRTFSNGFTACDKNATLALLLESHNKMLDEKIENITRTLKGSNIVYLQQEEAIRVILFHAPEYGFPEKLKPCCIGECSKMDTNGTPLYTVCDNPERHLFWDLSHLTQAGWDAVVLLYTGEFGFTKFTPSLRSWVRNL